ncbi:hypothetical protein [Saccharopolyspora mangrovi]|uniref:Uncharacterized protein n=1 Tax=Saccharopolyspora mangrovi TaxID=3082379 RepID=A0ABU6AGV2_9PSEU|nr:hypothetical protein [Saccharopolyspora sp. S2-29]MEB3370745.1 hypothetical protein [Saccharopolyspora sp. S2-29]
MAFTATLTDPTLDMDWFAEQLAAVVTFFAAQPKPADDEPEPRSEISGRTDPVPGEPVDTSHHDESRSPVASAGAGRKREPRKGRKRSNEKRD